MRSAEFARVPGRFEKALDNRTMLADDTGRKYYHTAKRGGSGMFYEVEKDALALLRAMKEHHDQHNPDVPLADGTRLAPELVAERVGLEPETLRYERALRYLVREGALVWEERLGSVPGLDFYGVTGRALEMLGAS